MDYLKDYHHIRGFNYTPSSAFNDVGFWRDYDSTLVERELTYAERLGLNSARIFLSYVVYERDPQRFLERVRHFLRAAHARGISTMVVVWDSCFDETIPAYETQMNGWVPNPGVARLGTDFWADGERYCADLVEALRDEPGLLMWDVMNEPRMTSWLSGSEAEARTQVIWAFVRHFCAVIKRLDPQHPITVGVHVADDIAQVGQHVDVITCHDYLPTRAAIRAHIRQILDFCEAYRKPALLSEIGCLARSNPYDVTLE
ncbi:MAG: cellulase family glycosylhydrolase, partial [Anaerolineae bacterium]